MSRDTYVLIHRLELEENANQAEEAVPLLFEDEEIQTVAGFVAAKRMPELLSAFTGFFGADHAGIRQMQAEFLAFGLAHDAILDYVRMRKACTDIMSVVDEMDKLTHICDISNARCVRWRPLLREIAKNMKEDNHEGK